jgi:DNA-binding XRE family transcriptional regulator
MTAAETTSLYKIISKRVREVRKERKMNQQQLAEAVGVDRTSIVHIEQGRQRPPLHLIWSLAETLGLRPMDLIPTPEELATATATPGLDAKFFQRIEEAADGDPTILSKISQFLEEKPPKPTDE